MEIRVRYFASLRERVGRAEEALDVPAGTTAGEVWRQATGQPLPANVLVAVNMEYTGPEREVRAGDEVAFFPPVTGG
ncbi:MAG: molybdopterin converting factor subunit 1 [Gammaproteobacteria bacterium]|nr:MAG: molybdopterin converting factor subunit 1 [Gammaproteobacteria bacterium]